MARMNVYIPDQLKQRMDSEKGVNWSATAVSAFESKLNELDQHRRRRGTDEVRRRQEILEDLVIDIEHTMEWRAAKAEQYPEDSRNASCAEALSKAIPVVSALPTSHPLLVCLQQLSDGSDDLHGWIEAENEILARVGFDYSEDPHHLVETLQHRAEDLLASQEDVVRKIAAQKAGKDDARGLLGLGRYNLEDHLKSKK